MARNRQKYAKALLYKVWIGIIAVLLALPQVSSASALSRNWTVYGKSGAVSGSLLGAFDTPSGVAVDNIGNLYVADTGNHRIQKRTPLPGAVAVDGSGNVYVADSANYRIQKLDVTPGASGNWETLTQGSGKNPGQVSSPSSLAIDRDGNLYVADTRNHRVQKRDAATGVWSDWKKKRRLFGQWDRRIHGAVRHSGRRQ